MPTSDPRHVCPSCATSIGPDGIARIEVSTVVELLHAAADAMPDLDCTDCAALALRDQAAALAAVAEGLALAYTAAELTS